LLGAVQTYECAKLGDQLLDAETAAKAAEEAGDAAGAAKYQAEAKKIDSRMGFLTPILKVLLPLALSFVVRAQCGSITFVLCSCYFLLSDVLCVQFITCVWLFIEHVETLLLHNLSPVHLCSAIFFLSILSLACQ